MAIEATLGSESAGAGPLGGGEPARASLRGHVLTLPAGPDPEAALATAQASFLVVNDGPPARPLAAKHLPNEEAVQVLFLAGAGSGDAARLLDASGEEVMPVDVATRTDGLPGPRWGSAVADTGEGVVYVLGGAVTPEMIVAHQPGPWRALDSIVRVDLGAGEARTMHARLPRGLVVASAVWDPRQTPACPEGCAYVMGGLGDDATPQLGIVRYDPVSDEATTLDVRLPDERFDLPAVWTGTHALILGAGAEALRFDPLSERVDRLAASPLLDVMGAGAFFDARTSLLCPRGCAYVLGGRESDDPMPPLTTPVAQRDAILRVDPDTGIATPLPARLPTRLEGLSVAWDGRIALVVGGRSCSVDPCERASAVHSFDPQMLLLRTLAARVEDRPEGAIALARDGETILVTGKTNANPAGAFDAIVRMRLNG